jgi:hypothetical protein
MAHELVDEQNIETFTLSLSNGVERFKDLGHLIEDGNPIRFVRLETSNLTEIQLLSYNKLIQVLDKYFRNYQLIMISKNKLVEPNPKIIWHKLESFDKN